MGWALGQEGELDEGIAHIQRGQEMLENIGAWLGYLQVLNQLSETYRKAGKVSEGLAVIDKAQGMIQNMGNWMEEPEIHRLEGELLLMGGGAESKAETCFQRAIEVAQDQGAKSWELRATMSLCRLWQKQGKHEQARTMLAEIYDPFTEGFDTPDLREAKACLEALS